MSTLELFITAVGLSMDAFAVAVCKGLKMPKLKYLHGVIIALFFGGFQALMPLIGWFLGKNFEQYIKPVDHWIAFALLAFIGAKMIYEAIKGGDEDDCGCESFDLKELLVMSVATSIDALAVGISYAALGLNGSKMATSVVFIGAITFTLSFIGVIIGHFFGAKFKSRAELAGGIILVLMGTKILLEHLGVIDIVLSWICA